MAERNQNGALQSSQKSMAALNKTAQDAQNALNSMSQPGKGGKGQQGDGSCDNPGGSNPGGEGEDSEGSAMQQFLSQMEKLTAQQQQLNDMMNGSSQGGAQAQELRQQAQLQKMAAQQQSVQKS